MALLHKDLVRLAFQISDFVATKHQYADIVTERTREKLEQITAINVRPVGEESRSRTRSKTNTESQPTQLWPSDWAFDRSSFRKSVNTFLNTRSATPQPEPEREEPGQLSTLDREREKTDESSELSTPPAIDNDDGNSRDANAILKPSDKAQPQQSNSSKPGTARSKSRIPKPTSRSSLRQDMTGESSSTQSPSGFTETQRAELVTIIQAAFQQQKQSNTPVERRVEASPAVKEWNPDDIGFFDPEYEGSGPVVNAGKSVFYRDVYAFIDRLKDMEAIRGEDKLRAVIPQCFRGSALIWHSAELSEMEKSLLRRADLLGWYEALTARFKLRTPQALKRLQQAKYTFTDAKERKDPRHFVQDIVRHARAAQIESVYHQLSMAWQNLDWQFRLHIPEPTSHTTLQKFLDQLNGQADMWFDMAESQQQPSPFQHNLPLRGGARSGYTRGWSRQQNSSRSSENDTLSKDTKQAISGFLQFLNDNNGPVPNRRYNNSQPDQPTANRPAFKPRPNTTSSSPHAKEEHRTSKKLYLRETTSNGRQSENAKGKQKAYMIEEDQDESDQEQPLTDENIDYYDPDAYDNNNVDGNNEDPSANFTNITTTSSLLQHECRKCQCRFPSNNQLHHHLRSKTCQTHCYTKAFTTTINKAVASLPQASVSQTADQTAKSLSYQRIITSEKDSNKDVGTGYGFRGWKYATAMVSLTSSQTDYNPKSCCLDSGAGVTLVDQGFFKSQCKGTIPIKTMATPITVRGIGSSQHQTDQYAIVPMMFEGTQDEEKVFACIYREVHLVKELKANLLIGTDILGPEEVILDLGLGKAYLGSCKVSIPILVKSRSNSPNGIQRPVHIQKTTIIPPRSIQAVPIHHIQHVPTNREYLFEPDNVNFAIYAHLISTDTSSILVRNNENTTLTIPRNFKLGHLVELDYPHAFHAGGEDIAELGLRRPKSEHKEAWFKKLLRYCTVAMGISLASGDTRQVSIDSTALHISKAQQPFPPPLQPNKPQTETKLPNGVTIHNSDNSAVSVLTALVNEFPEIWKDSGFAKLPEDHWMQIPLQSDWEKRVDGKAKVYPLGIKDREFVDTTFDELHSLGRMSWTKTSTPFSYPCFVVWKTLPSGERKGRVVVDIRGLNNLTIPDAYPLPLQSDIIFAVRDCSFITVIDCVSFYYQWRVHPNDRHKLTVVSHRGQECFNVAVMGYKNSPSYVQRQIDRILRPYRHCARAYVDDIVIFSRTLEDHVRQLRQIFGVLRSNNISIKPTKAFIGYPSVQLLGQKVDSLGLATTEEKLKAIAKLKFPRTLRQLEHYLGLTGWLREYVKGYAKISEPLQLRKTLLLKTAPIAGNARRSYASRAELINPSQKEILAFKTLQAALSKKQYLVHFNPARQLHIDIDASKESGMGAMIFHLKKPSDDEFPTRTNIEPIMFISRLLTPAETRYWPTELELAGLVWVLRKTRHLVEATELPTIVYTDHGASLGIAKQTTLSTSSTDKLNLRLVRASDYIQRFQLIIKHKPGKQHIVPDALSRLNADNKDGSLADHDGELDVLFTSSLVEMSKEFRNGIIAGYNKDPFWKKVLQILVKQQQTSVESVLPFCLDDSLIFRTEGYTSSDHGFEPRRLCIPQSMIKEILHANHDAQSHLGFARCYERVASTYYIRCLSNALKVYLKHCPTCQVSQTRRHQPYGNLQPILSPPIPFHSVTLDFILALPPSHSGMDNLMTVTCKFSKRVILIPGRSTWSASQWAAALLQRLQVAEWGLPKVIITDRDRKFLSDLWASLFTRLGVKLLYSTAYHPQSDGQSERTNQTVEIAFRFFLTTLPNPANWEEGIGPIQSSVNNSRSSSTGKSPNEVVYGFTPTQSTDLVSTKAHTPLIAKFIRIEVADAIAFSQMSAKWVYDKNHKSITLAVGDFALLRLHKGYKIPSSAILGPKLSQQYAGPFKVLARIGNLAYRLDIPAHWRVHPVFTIAQLEPCPNPDQDPFQRSVQPRQPDSVFVEGDTDAVKSYEIDRIVSHRNTRRRGIEYLVRWKEQGPEFDEWRNAPELGDAQEILEGYQREYGVAQTPPPSSHSQNLTTGRNISSPTPPSTDDPLYRPTGTQVTTTEPRITRAQATKNRAG